MKAYLVSSFDFYDGQDDQVDVYNKFTNIFKSKEKAINYVIQQIEEDKHFKEATFPNNIKELIEKNNRIYFDDETNQFVENLETLENGMEFRIEESEVDEWIFI